MSIRFFEEQISEKVKEKVRLRRWLVDVIRNEHKIPGNINIIFCSDEFLYELNSKYLKHNTLTDVITFSDEGDANHVSGEIYISYPRIRENSVRYQVGVFEELKRVVVHGVLHLVGYEDSSTLKRRTMTAKEDFYLDRFPK